MLFSWRVLLPALRLLRVLLVYVVVEPTFTPELNVTVPAPVFIPSLLAALPISLSLITFLTIVRLAGSSLLVIVQVTFSPLPRTTEPVSKFELTVPAAPTQLQLPSV